MKQLHMKPRLKEQ